MKQNNPPEFDDAAPPLPDYAAELEADLALGEPDRTPEEGIRVMTERINGLEGEVAHLRANAHAWMLAAFDAEKSRLRCQIREARQQLLQYQIQRDGKN